jgi:hypothetical protein
MIDDKSLSCIKCDGRSYPRIADINIDGITISTEGYVCELCEELYMDSEQMNRLIKTFDAKVAIRNRNIPASDKRTRIEDIQGFTRK